MRVLSPPSLLQLLKAHWLQQLSAWIIGCNLLEKIRISPRKASRLCWAIFIPQRNVSRNLATPNVVFNEQSLVKAMSAVVGSFVSSSLFYPLNVARLKLQCNPNVAGNMKQGLLSNFAFLKVIHHIINTQGFFALYQGWAANSLSLCLGSFVYFYLNSALQILYRRRRGGIDNKDLSYLAHIAVASISGMINVLITTPLWVATTRLTLQDSVNDNNSLDLERHAIPNKGVGSLTKFSTSRQYGNEEFKAERKIIATLELMGLLQMPGRPAV